MVIESAEKMVSSAPQIDIVQNKAITLVDNFFYGNLIGNYKSNLAIEESLIELNISKKDVSVIEKEFKNLFKECESSLKSGSEKGKFDSKSYETFKKKLNKISKNGYKLLLEIEKVVDYDACEKEISMFKSKIGKLGKKLVMKNEGMGISIGFEGDNDEDDDYEEKKITDFNNFSIDLESYAGNDKWINLEDEKGGYFHGQYYQSKNKKYLVAYVDSYGKVDKNGKETNISGQVLLIKDKKKILWRKDIERPNGAFVNNDGIVVVMDWISYSGELAGLMHIFNEKGKKLLRYKFSDSNIGGQEMSEDGKEIIVTTCNPEDAIYLFDLIKQKLVKKVNNPSKWHPLTEFKFTEAKKMVLDEESYKKKEYKKKKEEPNTFGWFMDKAYECRNSGKFKKGIDYFKKAMKIKTTGSLLKGLGYCYQELGKFDEAIKYFKKAMETSKYQRDMLPKYIEMCKIKRKNFNECTQEEIDKIYLKTENRDLKKERGEK